jgi:predicted dehydrogenase
MNRLRFGVLGVSGHFIKRIALPLMKSEKTKIYGIASRNIEKAQQTAETYGISKAYGSYEDLIADPNIDAVFIPLPNHMHKEWIFKCLDAGKHVLCEKPLAMNTDEVMEIIDYAKDSGLKVMEAFMIRSHPKWKKAKTLVENRYIGDVTQIHTVFSYNNQDPANIRNIKDFGGGALYDIGCYAINTARFILGKAPTRVVSLITEHPEFKTDMTTSAILDFDGVRTLFTVSTASFPQQEVKIFGTEGTITVTIPFNDVSEIPGKILFENNDTTKVIDFEPTNQYRLMFEEFADSIRTNSPVPISLSDSLENMKTIDAVFKSAKTGTWVDV